MACCSTDVYFSDIRLLPDFESGNYRLDWVVAKGVTFEPDTKAFVQIAETDQFDPTLAEIEVDLSQGYALVDLKALCVRDNMRPHQLAVRLNLVSDDQSYHTTDFLYLDTGSVSDNRKATMAYEIIRKELLRHTKFTGSRGALLRRRVYGEKNLDDVDPITGIVVGTGSSLEVGIADGYHQPQFIYWTREQFNEQEQHRTQNNSVRVETMQVRLPAYPLVNDHDVLVDSSNRRWLLRGVQHRKFPGTEIVTHQMATASLLAIDEPVYKFTVNWNG